MSLKLSNSIIHIYSFASFCGFNVSVAEIFKSTAGRSGVVPLETNKSQMRYCLLDRKEIRWRGNGHFF